MTKNSIQLEKIELEKIHSMIKEYRQKYDEINNLEETLKKLTETREQIKKQLSEIRKKEDDFGKDLVKKYGKGRFNVKTFEYELENE